MRGKQNKEIKPNFVIIINCRIIANKLNKYFISLAFKLHEVKDGDFGISIAGIFDYKDKI